MIIAALISIATGLLVNEFCELCPWCARKLVHWSAFRLYPDTFRAEVRAEELAAVINDRPGKLFKLITALCFTAKACVNPLPSARRGPVETEPQDQPDPDDVLTYHQRTILLVIRDSVQHRGYPPSLREIAEVVGRTNTSGISLQLAHLAKKGYLQPYIGRPHN